MRCARGVVPCGRVWMNKGCRDAQMAVFFFFHEAGEGVGMERMLCWWLAELLSLPRTAQAQYDATQHIPLSQAKAGDLVFFHSTYNSGTYVTHVGIYAGNNRMYHAGDPIGYADLTSPYWQKHLIGAGRVKSK